MNKKLISFLNWFFLSATVLSLCLGPLVYIRKFSNKSDSPIWLTTIQFILYVAFVVYTIWFIYNRIVKRKKTNAD